ncbi:alcohol dehydrogenase catalytic domain-containing protein [Pseudomonas sp. dw_358]|uniref:zinc-dependent alcohol dehydrogenase n=1 Tax=Pseudomonas sp. dw_358 TaxID=2720083 RepID=UPI001BD36B4F|nr:alcohol dehydrogenase catalytic domain-containing protein [Pseudomonas sp. dw_358]
MKALRFHGKQDIRFEDIPVPGAIPAGHVRLQVLAAGVCGSDIHNLKTGQWISQLPVTPGHEFCARITELGSGVEGFAVGDRVVVDSRAHCGQCDFCLAGAGNLCRHMGFVGEVCDGGFAEQSVQPVHRLLPIPDGVSNEIAALAEPLGVALRVLNRLAPAPGAAVLVAGGGPIGGLAAILLRELDDRPVYLIERNEGRAQLLKDVCGVIPVPCDSAAIHAAMGGTEPAYCIEATGNAMVMEQLIAAVASGGRIALVGLSSGLCALSTNAIVEREIELVGCSVFREEQRQAMGLLERLSPLLRQVIDGPVGLEQILQVYEAAGSGANVKLKTIIQP